MQIKEALQWYKTELSSVYDALESRAISELVLMHVFNFSKSFSGFDFITASSLVLFMLVYLTSLFYV